MSQQRKRIWIDRFQTVLIGRIAIYCVLFQVAAWSIVVLDTRVRIALHGVLGPEAAAYSLVVAICGGLLLSLIFMYDAIRFAHRFVGPIYRFRKVIQAIAAGEELELVRLRQGDYMLELRDDFNAMLKALHERGAISLKQTNEQQAATV